MVLQVGADARPIEHHRNTVLTQLFGRSDAGKQQNLWRPDRAGRENDFAAAARLAYLAAFPPAHADGTPSIELDALDQAACFQPEIAAMQRWLEKRGRCRPAPAALLVHVKGAAAFVVAGI